MPPLVDDGSAVEGCRLLDLSYASVFENLALEEALAREAKSTKFSLTVRFWVDPRSVILGRFQRVSNEVDIDLCERGGIEIGRRFTGGGAVFHDEGNLSLTIVRQRKAAISPTTLYESMAAIILDAVNGLGLQAAFLPPNSILVDGRKVSGSAAALGAGFALWHSSILVSSDLDLLEKALAPSKRAGSTVFVRSQWHPVTSLQNALGERLSLESVEAKLIGSIQRTLGVELNSGELTSDELSTFTRLYKGKYLSQDWNRNGTCHDS